MENKSTQTGISDLLDIQLDQLGDLMPFLLLFVTASITGIAYMISKFLVEGVPNLNLFGKIVLSVEFLLLLMAAGNAIGSYATAKLVRGEISSKKCALLVAEQPPELGKFIDELGKTIDPLLARQAWYYKNSYLSLSLAVLIGTIAALIRIWT